MKLKFYPGLLFTVLISCQNNTPRIDYFGQIPPGKSPTIFAPGTISLDNRCESRGAFSPDGSMFYFTVSNNDFSVLTILVSEYSNNEWSKPDTAHFSKSSNNYQPFFSFDGQKLFFTSDRERETEADFYFMDKLDTGWSEPRKLEAPINSEYTDHYLSQSKNGTFYFSSTRPGGIGHKDIYFAYSSNNEYGTVENIGIPINQEFASDPCIAPDESYLIFNAFKEEGYGRSDLYISFKKNGLWTEPQNMGKRINTEAGEFDPFLSPDHKYLFFCRYDGETSDMYWVDIKILDDYRGNL